MNAIIASADSALAAAFWFCVAGVLYVYLGYPLIVLGLSRLFGARPVPPRSGAPHPPPTVALIIAAHNEAEVIEQRIHNALALDYPADRLQIVVASDGSDDTTAEICSRYAGRIVPMLFPQRRGKAATLNAAIEQITADIVVLSDANTSMQPDAVRMLSRWFGDASIGAVCGRLVITDPASGRNSDGLYWKFETFLKRCEGRLGGLLGANGAIYAIRTSLFTPLPTGTIVDDFVIPLRAKLLSSCRIIYDEQAVAHEESAPDIRSEFDRRARIGLGGWQALGLLWPLLNPRHGWTSLTFWSHKVLRWMCPFFMIGALASSLALSTDARFAALALAQLAFYLVAVAAASTTASLLSSRYLRACTMFAAMNLALLVGFFRWMRGGHSGIWQRTLRVPQGRPH